MVLGIITAVKFPAPILIFTAIHNLAIFSYFVSRSHENNIIHIAGFF